MAAVDSSGGSADATPSPVSASTTVNTTFKVTGLGDMATRATFLSAFIIVGFVGNCVLVATIIQSKRLRKSSLNLCMISLAVVNLIDCIVIMPLVLGSTISEKWDYGSFACKFNAFCLQITSIAVLLGIALMSLDRIVAVIDPAQHKKRLTRSRISILITFTWLQSVVISIPLLSGTIPSHPFPARYLCSVANSASLLYIAMTSLLGFIIPIFVIGAFFSIILRVAIKEKLRGRSKNSAHAYNVDDVRENRVWHELRTSKYVVALFVCWIIFQGPYVLLNYVEQYRNSEEMVESGIEMTFTYPWELDLAFTWMKFSYAIFLPIITFCWRKEIWQKFKNFILCRKSNLIKDASPHSTPPPTARRPQATNGTQRQDSQANGSLPKVPVLFATENGLHFQTYDSSYNSTLPGRKNSNEEDEEASESYCSEEEQEATTMTEILTTRKCDVYGSRDILQGHDDDTSDYDSNKEMDPFSTSNPISVQSQQELQLNKSTASLTKKAAQGKKDSLSNESNKGSETSEQLPAVKQNAFDSGIDSNPNTKVKSKKKKKKKQNTTQVEQILDERNKDEEVEMDQIHRTSHDSGRGSKEGSVSHTEQHTPGLKESAIQSLHTSVETETKTENMDLSDKKVGNIADKKVKKRRKKETMVEDLQSVDNINKQSTTENGSNVKSAENKETTSGRRPPPPRLKPIDHKTERVENAPLRSAPKIITPEVQEIIPYFRKRVESVSSRSVKSDTDANEQLSAEPMHTRTSSDVSQRPERPRRKRDSGNGSMESSQLQFENGSMDRAKARPKSTKSTDQTNGSSGSHKHKQKELSESQTTLLSRSGGSEDLHNMQESPSVTPRGEHKEIHKKTKKKKKGNNNVSNVPTNQLIATKNSPR